MSVLRLFPDRIEGRHVLIALLAFFGVLIAANGIFIYYAVGTFNGLVSEDAYRTGLKYNQRIAAEETQSRRGWQPAVRYERDSDELVVTVRDAQGRGVAGLSISGDIRRPVTNKDDHSVTLRETAPARYTVPFKLASGQWILQARIREPGKAGEQAFRFKQRFWVKAAP